jgi:hypothetical protein
MSIEQAFYKPVENACAQWRDNRVIHRDDVMDIVLFVHFLEDICANHEWHYHGFQCRQCTNGWLLMVKITDHKVPLVAFVSGQNTTSCVTKFIDLLDRRELTWNRDKWPWI